MLYNNYFLTIIFPSSYSTKEIKFHLKKYIGFLKYTQSQEISANFFGPRLLSYPIKESFDGNLVVMKFSAFPTTIKRVQDLLRQDEKILRSEINKSILEKKS